MSKCTKDDPCDVCHYDARPFGLRCWMGPIEREIRRAASLKTIGCWLGISEEAFEFALVIAAGMGLKEEFLNTMKVDGDVLSEAIECAEALSL